MAADLMNLPQAFPVPPGLTIIPVEDKETLKEWIHIASVGFKVPGDCESSWCDMFAESVFELPFRNYLALLEGEPVGTSQLFLSGGVAGIYNVTCLPHVRGQGVGGAVTLAPLLEARQMGYRVSILQASELGYRVYRRLGFQEYGKLSVFLWDGERAL
jgi:GNAT superfamily N-acetyltransferase